MGNEQEAVTFSRNKTGTKGNVAQVRATNRMRNNGNSPWLDKVTPFCNPLN